MMYSLRAGAQGGNKQNVQLVFILYSKAVKNRVQYLYTENKIPRPGKNLCTTSIINSQNILHHKNPIWNSTYLMSDGSC
jgi:hypothetical protein